MIMLTQDKNKMQKLKIVFIATLTASIVGIVNIIGSFVAYSLVIPVHEETSSTLIATSPDGLAANPVSTSVQNISKTTQTPS